VWSKSPLYFFFLGETLELSDNFVMSSCISSRSIGYP